MKILYGACGEGMGHAIRVTAIARHLERRGHGLKFASYGPARRHLQRLWPGQVMKVPGLGFSGSGGRVDPVASVASNVLVQSTMPAFHAANFIKMSRMAPDVVLTDFEPTTARFAQLSGVPLISIDHQHFITRCAHPAWMLAKDRNAADLAYMVVANMVGRASRYLVVTFADMPVIAPGTSLHLPAIREEILARRPHALPGEHVVVYFNKKYDFAHVLSVLAQVPVKFHVYGVPGINAPETRGNLTLAPFMEQAFFDDMATCGAIIGGAGFEFPSEAMCLGKPMLAIPYGFQFEQSLNADYLQLCGYGERCDHLSVQQVAGFFARVPHYRQNLRSFQHDNNAELMASIDVAIAALAG